MLDLGIVVVNYHTCGLLHACLRSLQASTGDVSFGVCVVDNASTDGSGKMVEERFPDVHLIQNAANLGYPRANNQGLRHFGFSNGVDHPVRPAAPRFALLLNPDTEVPDRALADLVRFLEAHPDAGVVGPKLVLPSGELDLACRRSFPTPTVSLYRFLGLSRVFPHSPRFGKYNLTYLDPDSEAEVDSVVGACMMVRAEAIQQAGLLDETFFMYGEDLDWAFRIKAAGWKVLYNPAVIVKHVKRASSRQSRRAQVEFYRAMKIFYEKHYAKDTPWYLHALIEGAIALRTRLAQWRSRNTSGLRLEVSE